MKGVLQMVGVDKLETTLDEFMGDVYIFEVSKGRLDFVCFVCAPGSRLRIANSGTNNGIC